MTYELDTKLLTKRGCSLITTGVVEWCALNMPGGRKKYWPAIIVERWDSIYYDAGEVAFYDVDDNEIHLAYNKIRTVEELVRTVIHEWTHYNQSRRKILKDQDEQYREQECEVEAFAAEERLYQRCWTDIQIIFT